ncbi:MAG TPA: hypothetical protein V6D19_22090 [Stenomitos sp.]
MSQQLQSQATQWWQTVASQKTIKTYQDTAQITWSILQETLKLAWLILCLGLVLFGWLWQGSTSSGQRLKTWIDSLEEPKANTIWLDTKNFLLEKAQVASLSVLNQARTQLGLATVAPATPAAVITASQPVAAPPAKAPAPVSKAASTSEETEDPE